MLTDQDIAKLVAAQKGAFATKADVTDLKQSFGVLDSKVGSLDSKVVVLGDRVGALDTKVVSIEERMATKVDLLKLQAHVTKEMVNLEERVTGKFSDLQTSVDRYLKFTETWHQELTILKGRHDRLAQALVGKGIVTEKEIALLA